MHAGTSEEELRSRALARLKKKRDFVGHLLAYVTVNGFIVMIWAFAAGGGFFWPMFPIVAWGIGLFFHAWDLYSGEPSEEDIAREMERMARGGR